MKLLDTADLTTEAEIWASSRLTFVSLYKLILGILRSIFEDSVRTVCVQYSNAKNESLSGVVAGLRACVSPASCCPDMATNTGCGMATLNLSLPSVAGAQQSRPDPTRGCCLSPRFPESAERPV